MGNYYKHKRKKSNILWTAFKSSIVVVFLLMLLLILVILIGYKEPGNVKDESEDLEIVYLNLPGMRNEEETIVKEDVNQIDEDQNSNSDETETEETMVASIEETITGPFDITVKWVKDSEDGYIVKYRQVSSSSEKHGKANREDNSMSMSEICTCFAEGSEDSGIEDANHGWHSFETDKGSFDITGLTPGREYEVHILYKNNEEYHPKFHVTTASSGYGDPFLSIDAILTLSTRDENTGKVLDRGSSTSVKMSSVNGCNGVTVKPVISLPVYSDADKSEQLASVAAGSELKIMVDTNLHYCYLAPNGDYYVRVKNDTDNIQGWVNARFLMVDAYGLFKVDDTVCGIHIDRTNAKGSIFTAGGNGNSVDITSEENSRYDCLADGNRSVFLNSSGYNTINNVTNQKLANYGSENQMPVIWDLALELIQCQKNSLENGYTLLIYEGYRPYSASQQVSGNLSGQGILSNVVYNTNLAQGFLTDKTYDYSYYISKASRHNKGTATDLTLCKVNSLTELGNEVNMQTKMHTLDFRCNMLYNNWQADLLSDIMMGHGSNLECLSVRSEWWHFQMNNSRTDIYPYIKDYNYYDIVF